MAVKLRRRRVKSILDLLKVLTKTLQMVWHLIRILTESMLRKFIMIYSANMIPVASEAKAHALIVGPVPQIATIQRELATYLPIINQLLTNSKNWEKHLMLLNKRHRTMHIQLRKAFALVWSMKSTVIWVSRFLKLPWTSPNGRCNNKWLLNWANSIKNLILTKKP